MKPINKNKNPRDFCTQLGTKSSMNYTGLQKNFSVVSDVSTATI